MNNPQAFFKNSINITYPQVDIRKGDTLGNRTRFRAVLRALRRWEPRVSIESVRAVADPERGALSIVMALSAGATLPAESGPRLPVSAASLRAPLPRPRLERWDRRRSRRTGTGRN